MDYRCPSHPGQRYIIIDPQFSRNYLDMAEYILAGIEDEIDAQDAGLNNCLLS
jgi:hypothetical protein